jgi:glucose/arabinose dehydrogenase
MQSYVDNHPPEPFTSVADGANYGWPYCNPNPDTSSGLKSMPFDRDVQNNADGSHLNCDTGTTKLAWGLPAHSAPLGLSFWTGASAPADYRNGAVIAQHGCWNCKVPHGYKVSFAPLGQGGVVQAPFDLVTGFLSTASNKDTAWARPVDVVPNRAGNLYISDDKAGTIFELYRR